MSIEDTNAVDPITGETRIAGRDITLDLKKEFVDPITPETGIAGRDITLDLKKEFVDPITPETEIFVDDSGF